ncbi:MAG: hypothetical protein OEU54_16840, partial [Gemmatimonadota bacterium]|nr:hypothetical protein [Gemmatimonadota bacterium]
MRQTESLVEAHDAGADRPAPRRSEESKRQGQPAVSVIVRVTEHPLAPDDIYHEYAPTILAEEPTAEFL